jgi:hypothetical protein
MRVDGTLLWARWLVGMRKVLHLYPYCLLPEELCR